MVKPIDIGIWQFWMTSSDDEDNAAYGCENCGYLIRTAPKNLPKKCPRCNYTDTQDSK